MSITADLPGGGLDAAEFADLYSRHRDALARYCRKRINDPDAVEDLVQSVFEKAFASRHLFDPSRDFWPWLASIAARACIDAHRRAMSAEARLDRYVRETHREPFDVTATTVLQALGYGELGRRMDALPASQRAAIGLFALDEWSYDRIARDLGYSSEAVKSLIRRARSNLRKTVDQWAGTVIGVARLTRSRVQHRLARMHAAVVPPLDALGLSAAGVLSSVSTVGLAIAVACGVLAPPTSRTTSRPPWADAFSAAGVALPEPVGPRAATASSERDMQALPPGRRPVTGGAERTGAELMASVAPGDPTTTDPEWMQAASYAVSPDYEHDPTVFVLGEVLGRRLVVDTPLVVTHDDGASWHKLRAAGLWPTATRLLLPPAYPRDNRLFAVGAQGLQVSFDGGHSFATLLTLPDTTDGALSPRFDAGDATILLVAGGRLWQYDDGTGLAVPVAVAGEPAEHLVLNVGFVANADGEETVILASLRLYERDGITRFVSRCTRGVAAATGAPRIDCASAGLPNTASTTLPVRVPPGSRSGAIFVSSSSGPWISTDQGRTFRQARPSVFDESEPFYYTIYDLVAVSSPSGQSAMVAQWTRSKRSHDSASGPQLARTDDGGARWMPITVSLPRFDFARSLVVTPTGRIIAGSGQGGLACSADGGRTWGRTCAAVS